MKTDVTGVELRRTRVVHLIFDGNRPLSEAILAKMLSDRGVTVSKSDRPSAPDSNTYEAIAAADLVAADVTSLRPSALIQLGYAVGRGKPTFRYTYDPSSLSELKDSRVVIFDKSGAKSHDVLVEAILNALEHPDSYSPARQNDILRAKHKVFISYSHSDLEYLRRLLVHLKPLERDRQIDLWVDSRIKAGDNWKETIGQALEAASTAILLVSADFLASDFIVEDELPPLLRRAQEGGTRIIPVIVKPCRFTRDPHLSGFQAINDPDKPLVMLGEGNRESVYDSIAREVEPPAPALAVGG